MTMRLDNTPTHRPPYVSPGSKIAIVSPAKNIDSHYIYHAKQLFESWGLQVEIGEHAFDSQNYYAGTDTHRGADLQKFINRSDIAAIICSRGGYGSIRTLQYLNFEALKIYPKWIVGYSDISVFHSLLNSHFSLETIHATMPLDFSTSIESQQSIDALRAALFGTLTAYHLPTSEINVSGCAKGRLVGGNLSVLYSLAATPADIILDNTILFIEDVGESIYHIDRMMMNLLYSGKLSKIKALLVGGMTSIGDTNPPYGSSVSQVILQYVKDMHIPVAFDFPAGHVKQNLALYLGRQCELSVDNKATVLTF